MKSGVHSEEPSVGETFRRTWKMLSRSQRLRLTFLATLRSATSLLDIAGLLLVGLAGAIASGTVQPPDLAIFDKLDRSGAVVTIVTGATIVLGARTLLTTLLSKYTLVYLATIEIHFTDLIIDDIFQRQLPEIKRYSRAEIDWIVSRSSQTAITAMIGNGMTLIAETIVAMLVLIFLVLNNWLATAAVTLYLICVFLVLHFVTHSHLERAGRRYSEASLNVGERITNHISAFREIFVSHRGHVFASLTKSARADAARSAAELQFIASLPRIIIESALVFGTLAFLSIGILFFSALGGLEFFAIFLLGGMRISASILPLQRAWMAIISEHHMAMSAQQAAERALVVDAPAQSSVQHPTSGPTHSDGALSPPPSITASNLTFSYSPASSPTLTDINFEVKQGSITAFVGHSGAGKSTLVDLILGLQAPNSGSITIGGLPSKLYREVGGAALAYVPQRPGLIAGSILENIVLDPNDTVPDMDGLMRSIEIAQLAEWVDQLPEGLNTRVGSQNDSLSGGQIQRLGIARALYRKPGVLILDEATSALDAETESETSKHLWNLAGSTTILVVAHRLSTIMGADQIILLGDGRIQATGTFESLRKTNSQFRNYIKLLGMTTG